MSLTSLPEPTLNLENTAMQQVLKYISHSNLIVNLSNFWIFLDFSMGHKKLYDRDAEDVLIQLKWGTERKWVAPKRLAPKLDIAVWKSESTSADG